jgi:hypothetical protein
MLNVKLWPRPEFGRRLSGTGFGQGSCGKSFGLPFVRSRHVIRRRIAHSGSQFLG